MTGTRDMLHSQEVDWLSWLLHAGRKASHSKVPSVESLTVYLLRRGYA